MKLDKLKKLSREDSEVYEEVAINMAILDRIHELLDEKFDGKQKLLAEKMGKSESEISRLLSGVQNYTTRTLIKFQRAFGAQIIAVCSNEKDETTFEEVRLTPGMAAKSLCVEVAGKMSEKLTEYESIS